MHSTPDWPFEFYDCYRQLKDIAQHSKSVRCLWICNWVKQTKSTSAQSVISFRAAIFQNSQHNPIKKKTKTITPKYGLYDECAISYSSWFHNSTPDAIYNTCLLLQALCLTIFYRATFWWSVCYENFICILIRCIGTHRIEMENAEFKMLQPQKKGMRLQTIKFSACALFGWIRIQTSKNTDRQTVRSQLNFDGLMKRLRLLDSVIVLKIH